MLLWSKGNYVLDTETGGVSSTPIGLADNVMFSYSGYITVSIRKSFVCRPLDFGYYCKFDEFSVYWRGYEYPIASYLMDIDLRKTGVLSFTVSGSFRMLSVGGNNPKGIKTSIDVFERKCFMFGD